MNNFYWIGARESDIVSENIFCGSVTRFGSNTSSNVSFPKARQKYTEDEFLNFIIEALYSISANDKNCKFIFSNPQTAYKLPNDLISKCDCLNNFPITMALNDKFFVRQYLSDVSIIPPCIILNGELAKNISFVRQIFNNQYSQFIAQKPLGGGGRKTFFIDENVTNLNEADDYIITPYYNNKLPLNIHCIIFKNDILILPPSVQLIVNNFNYMGADFCAAKKLSVDIKNELFFYALKICKKFQTLGAKGIVGLDFLLADEQIIFLESNFRFQGSSFLLNNALRNTGTSLYELYLKSFYEKKSNIDGKIFFMDIDLSFCKSTSRFTPQIPFPPIKVNLDGFSEQLMLSENAYKYNCIYDKSLLGVI